MTMKSNMYISLKSLKRKGVKEMDHRSKGTATHGQSLVIWLSTATWIDIVLMYLELPVLCDNPIYTEAINRRV